MSNEERPKASPDSSLVTRHSSLVLTVTPNTGLDRVLFLERLHPGRNAARVVWAMGGKGCDVSLILRGLEVPTTATGFAAGDIGHRMELMLEAAGVECAFVRAEGETRINTVIIEEQTGTHTTLCAESLHVRSDHEEALVRRVEGAALHVTIGVLAGSLPEGVSPELYPRLIRLLRRAGVSVILDAAEPYLGAALAAGVDAVKPNRAELARWAGEAIPDVAAAARAARRMREAGAGMVLASLDRDGMLLAVEEGTWYAPPLSIPVKNPAGAGDGAVAGLCEALLRHASPPEQLECAVRIASAVCMTAGTAEFHLEDLHRLPPVQIRRCE